MVIRGAVLLVLAAGPALAQDQPTSPPPSSLTAPPALPGRDAGPPTLSPPNAPQGFDMGAAAMTNPGPEAASITAYHADIWGLVVIAHPVVQAVMALLVLAIAAVLTVLLFKAVEFTLAFARLRRAGRALAAAPGLVALPSDCPLAEATRAAHAEIAALPRAVSADLRASARERLDVALERIEARAVQRLRSGSGLLASIGAVAPFVGLFGTVFGIMNSFLAIAETKTTSLVVVAPGIAEALLATGIGLVAAIPAVLLYNRIMRRIGTFRHRLADGTAEVLRRFSHELDARMAIGKGA